MPQTPLQELIRPDVAAGSKADLTLGAKDVGSYLNNGHGVRTSDVMEFCPDR